MHLSPSPHGFSDRKLDILKYKFAELGLFDLPENEGIVGIVRSGSDRDGLS